MMGDSTEGFPKAPNGEGGIDLLSSRRHGLGVQPTPATTIEPSNRSSYSNYSTTVGNTTVRHRPPPQAS
jgi:hypothetical protein